MKKSVREEEQGRKRGCMVWWGSLSDKTKAALIGLIGTVVAAIITLIGVLGTPIITEFAKSLFAPTPVAVAPTITPTPTAIPTDTPMPTPTDTPMPTPTDTPMPTPTDTPMPTPTDTPMPTPTDTPMPTPTPAFKGKVCPIKTGWDTYTIFLRQAEFDALGLPIGTRVKVTVFDTTLRSVENVTLSLDHRLKICSVRLARPLGRPLGVDDDTEIRPDYRRPDRQFGITQTWPPTNKEATDFQGKVRQTTVDQDTKTIFLRQSEFDAFGVPAGTTVSVTVLDTGKTVERITLGLDSSLTICAVRLPICYREALGVAEDIDIEPLQDRPNRQFSIRLPHPP